MLAGSCSKPAPTVVVRENLSRLDPAVQSLIQAKVDAAQKEPRNASLHGDLGFAYEANLLWHEAHACFETASKLNSDEMLWKLHRAITDREIGKYDESLKTLKSLSTDHPDLAYIQQRLGYALLEIADLNGAKAAFEKVIELSPQASEGYAGLGDVLLQKMNFAEAISVLGKAVALDPKYRSAHYLLGRAYLRVGESNKAEIELAQGKNASMRFLPDPGTATVHQYAVNLTSRLQQAQSFLSDGNAEQAAKLLEEAMTHHPENVSLLNNLALANMRMGQLQKAESLLNKAQQHKDGQHMTAINLSSLMLRTDRAQKALEYADAAIALAPKLDQAYFSRALALSRLGRNPEAIVSVEDALNRNSQNLQNHAFAAELYMKLGEYEKAKAALNQARQLAPDHPLVKQLEQRLQRTTQ